MTKLTNQEKATLKAWKKDAKAQGAEIQFFPEYGVTFVVKPLGKTQDVSWSICSDEEPKARKKVGAYHALNRWHWAVSMPVPANTDLADLAYVLCMGEARTAEGYKY